MTAPKQVLPKQHPLSFFNCVKCIAVLLILLTGFYTHARCNGFANTNTIPADTIISGIVKDINGKPIGNAKITSAITGDVYTNSDGLFSITLSTEKIVPQSFIFRYDTLMPVVRSYHPVMENAIYEITLEPKKCCLRELWMGIMCTHTKEPQSSSINFETNIARLSVKNKSTLKEVAAKLKDNPELTVIITAYPAPTDPKQRVADKRLLSVQEYLTEQMGISSDRIIIEKKPGEGDGNAIEIKIQ